MINRSQANYHYKFKKMSKMTTMTFSILAHDQKTGTFGAAAATGSLCVGGWVLRGSLDAGLVASQGTSPSTLWRDQALGEMGQGATAENTVKSITQPDDGRAHRQFIALDRRGGTGAFTGAESIPWAGHIARAGLVCAGNMIAGKKVLDELMRALCQSSQPMADRLISALGAAERAGGDSRGLLSSALLVLSPGTPPLDLRIDHYDRPISALEGLLARARARPYADWLHEVPVANDPKRAPKPLATPHS